ncbi:hypothetical protein L2729_15585 [Shewanella gelidimarina]|uniref:hypothetical protein n=1 Tax=Shewanella gelidimarina TaxID=56813 RepID=UPI00200E9875|nr:hypothetical protein [Shewanella gelidimarina]MCL1059393.1 hypothetical protein [Shewanella gelidimarina]
MNISIENLDGLKDLQQLSEIVYESVEALELLAKTKPEMFEVLVHGAGNIKRFEEAKLSSRHFSAVVEHISNRVEVGESVPSTREFIELLDVDSRPKTESVFKKLEAWGYLEAFPKSKTVLRKPLPSN